MVSQTAINNAHTAVGVIGNIISFGLFLSPVPTFVHIFKNKDVEEFQPWPYLFTVLNCLFWMFYGLPIVKKDNILVLTINSIGLAIELIYLTVYVTYTDKKRRVLVLLILLGQAIFLTGMVLTGMLAFGFSNRSLFVGIICDVFNIMMYASPLAVWKKVLETKSVEFMPFWLSLAGFANGLCWTAYALIKFDKFILISNGLGALLGAIQLILYACFYRRTPKKEKASEIEVAPQNRV